MAESGSARNSTRPRGTATAPRTLPDAATSPGSRTSRNSTSGRPSNPLASSGLILGTAASASASIAWTVFIWFLLLRRQARRLPGHHLPVAVALGVDVGEAHAEGVGRAVRHDLDLRDAGQHHRITKVLRLHVR